MTKWEYRRLIVRYSDFVSVMKAEGKDGWEAFAVQDGGSAQVEVFFKRPVQVLKQELLNE